MSLVPDTKDWTWVIERRCPECGFDAPSLERAEVGARIRADAEDWRRILAGGDVRRSPDEATWSPLEYACHVRDVYRLYDVRLQLMLAEDDPTYANWDQDATALEQRYAEQDPGVVAGELAEAVEQRAARFDSLSDDQWLRTGTRSDGARFTVDTFARYLVHDPVHHVRDVEG
jgi:hypothetical protein